MRGFQDKSNNKNKNKNNFVASLTSNKSGKTALWINPTDSFVMAVMGTDIKSVTAEEIEIEIAKVLASGNFSLKVQDSTIEKEQISAEDF